jgi:hypothetical protein
MSARPALRVIDGNGELIDLIDVADHGDPTAENKALRSALTRLDNAYKALVANKAAERQKYVYRSVINDAFEDWRDKLVAAGMKGKAKCKLTDDRFDAMKAMVEAGYTLGDFMNVNTGIAACRFVVYGKRRQSGPDDSLQVDIGYVCEKARRFEEAARLGAIVKKAQEQA